MKPLICLCDFDGVIADMEGKFVSIAGETWRDYEERTGKSGWPFVNNYNETVAPFFQTLDKLPDADLLLARLWEHHCAGRIVLKGCTSAGNQTRYLYAEQKRQWFKDMWPGYSSMEVITTESGVAKAEFAGGGVVLIDDTLKNVLAFSEAGGLVIHHMGAASTLAVLDKILAVREEMEKLFAGMED
jgi:hypothetical protein